MGNISIEAKREEKQRKHYVRSPFDFVLEVIELIWGSTVLEVFFVFVMGVIELIFPSFIYMYEYEYEYFLLHYGQ